MSAATATKGRAAPRPPASHVAPDSLALPRARAFTDALLCSTAALDVDEARVLAERVARAIGEAAAVAGRGIAGRPTDLRPGGACVRIGAHQLISAGRPATSPSSTSSPSPATSPSSTQARFQWTARRARRTVGLAALRSVLAGMASAPAEAVALVLGSPGGSDGLGVREPGSCADWLDSLSPAARVAVRAEATTWTTQLFCALEWERVGPSPIVGRPDRWWVCGDQVKVALRGRADVRLGGAGGVHLSMLAGRPTAEGRMALCLSAMVELLGRGTDAVPARVAGLWPEAGKAWVVPVDVAALTAVADAATRAVAKWGAGATAEG